MRQTGLSSLLCWVFTLAHSDHARRWLSLTTLPTHEHAVVVLQVAQRLMAVEVARPLLAELPDPYSASSVILPGSLPTPATAARVSIDQCRPSPPRRGFVYRGILLQTYCWRVRVMPDSTETTMPGNHFGTEENSAGWRCCGRVGGARRQAGRAPAGLASRRTMCRPRMAARPCRRLRTDADAAAARPGAAVPARHRPAGASSAWRRSSSAPPTRRRRSAARPSGTWRPSWPRR